MCSSGPGEEVCSTGPDSMQEDADHGEKQRTALFDSDALDKAEAKENLSDVHAPAMLDTVKQNRRAVPTTADEQAMLDTVKDEHISPN